MPMGRGFELIRQHDAMQCGAACLTMICRNLGKKVGFDHIATLCAATREGVSLLCLNRVAKGLGLESLCGRVTIDALKDIESPCILHWNQNHFVVLYKVRKNKYYYVADPAKGLIIYNKVDLEKHWISTKTDTEGKGIAMFFEPNDDFYSQQIDKENTEQRSFRFLFGYIKKYKRKFLLMSLALLVGSLLQLVLPFLTKSIVDIGITEQDIQFVWLVLLGQLMITFSTTLVNFYQRWVILNVSLRINLSLVSDFLIKLLKLPMSFFDTKLMGDLMQRMEDHGRVNSFLTQQTLSILFSIITFLVFSVVLLTYSPTIFTIFIIGSVIYGGWLSLFLKRRKIIDYELFEQQAINNNKTYELITSMQEIKLQDCEQRRCKEWEHVQMDLFNVQKKTLKIQQIQEAGSISINEIKNIIITVVTAMAVIQGQLTLGMMLAIQYIIGQLNAPIEQIMGFIYAVQDVKISLERINQIHNAKEEYGNQLESVAQIDNERGIKIKHVNFKYDPHALKNNITDASIEIPQGKVTAIVGASGSGKTTIIKLLLGYYPITEGEIVIGDVNINDLDKKRWRRECGVVMQEGVIFSESIARNIAVDDNEIDEEKMVEASKIACIYDSIMALPLKFNTKIGRDGMGLSQGQKQRILIARAIYKNPKFIFLDEATNALDANNERRIVENLDNYYKGRTVIIVAHRLSTVKNADQIIVLEKGEVIEKGNHKELTEKRGAYYNLVKNQLELGN